VLCCPKADGWPNADGGVPKAEGRPNTDGCVPPAKEDVGDGLAPNTLGLLANAAKPLPPLGLEPAPEPLVAPNALVVGWVPKPDGRDWPKEDCPKTGFVEEDPNALVCDCAPKLDVDETPNAELEVVGGLGVLGDAS